MKVQPSPSTPQSKAWAHDLMADHKFRRQRFLTWWYRIAAPPPAGANADYQERDRVQRGHTASLILLCLIPIMVGVFYIGISGPNKQIGWTALGVEGVIALCIWLNRKGRVNASGILLCLAVNIGMYTSILRAPAGLSPNDKDIFYLLVFAELIIGAILPARWIFVALVINLSFGTYMLVAGPHTPALDELLKTSLVTILLRLFQVHIIPSIIVWCLALTTRESIDRANYSEQVAMLQHEFAQQQKQQAEKTRELEHSIQVMSNTFAKIANGDLSARVPLGAGSTLWQIAGPINTLLGRLQRARQAEVRLQELEAHVQNIRLREHQWQRLTREIESTTQTVRVALQEGKPVHLIPGGTPLDPLLRELSGKYIMALPQPPRVSRSPETNF